MKVLIFVLICQHIGYTVQTLLLFASWKWCVLLHRLVCVLCNSTVAFPWSSAKRVHHPQGSSVIIKLLHIRIVAGTPSLPLATKKVLQWILTQVLAQKCQVVVFNFRQGEQVAYKGNKRFGCRLSKIILIIIMVGGRGGI